MTDWELILTMVGEKATTDITKVENSQGFEECKKSANEGGEVAHDTRKSIEKKLGRTVISKTNFLENNEKKMIELDKTLIVEETLKNMDESIITVAELKRKLPKQINHNNLKIILKHFEKKEKIIYSKKGITWIHNTSPKLKKAIKDGREV